MTQPLSHAHRCEMLSDAVVHACCMSLENLTFRGEAGKVQGVAAILSLSVRDWMALELMHCSEYESISPENLREPIHGAMCSGKG